MLETILSNINAAIAIALVLGACIFFHELGHFAVAKLVGMKVDEFALGFGWRLLGFRRGETTYRINAIPLGGYVRIAGMEPGAEPHPRGFHSFERWKGAGVLIAGSVMNVVLAAIAFVIVGVVVGVVVFPNDEIRIAKVFADQPAEQAGLQAGDQIVALDGMTRSILVAEVQEGGLADRVGIRRYDRIIEVGDTEVETTVDLLQALVDAARQQDAPRAEGTSPRGSVQLEIVRFAEDGTPLETEEVELPLPEDLPEQVRPQTAGATLERLLGVRFVPIGQSELLAWVSDHPNEPVVLTVRRGGQILDITVVPREEYVREPVEDEEGRINTVMRRVGRIGVVMHAETRSIPVGQAIVDGVQDSIYLVAVVLKGLYMTVTGELAPQASGPVGIAAMTAERARAGWSEVVQWTGMISVQLAVINMLPFPPFDGFRVVLLGIEAVIRRRVDERIEIGVTMAGIAIILGLFIVITMSDIANLVRFRTP